MLALAVVDGDTEGAHMANFTTVVLIGKVVFIYLFTLLSLSLFVLFSILYRPLFATNFLIRH